MPRTRPPFDEWVVVDWSTAARPVTASDSIWIGHGTGWGGGIDVVTTVNPSTRAAASAHLEGLVAAALDAGRTMLVGFDFSFGYPAGFWRHARPADADAGGPAWRATWDLLSSVVVDGPDNANNRFAAADGLNRAAGLRFFWGRPQGGRHDGLSALPARDVLPAGLAANPCAPLRASERLAGRGIRSGFQLYGRGTVGGQVLTGVPRLSWLRSRFGAAVAVWPFDTGFGPDPLGRPDPALARRDGRTLTPQVLLAEVWPSMFERDPAAGVRDEGQVRGAVSSLAALDAGGWARLLAPRSAEVLGPVEHHAVIDEEGWILGVV